MTTDLSQLSTEQRVELEKRLLRRIAASPRGIPRRPAGVPCPLSHAQQRLWFLDQYEPGSAVYNIPMAWALKGSLNIDALQRAFQSLVDRHEALRTTFAMLEDVPIQVVAPRAPVPFAVVDLAAGTPEQRKAECARLLEQHGALPFDLSRDVMIRAYVYRRADDDHVLLVNMHHIASDGWSIDIVIRELAEFYRAFASGTTPALAELPIQYADYAVWQRESLSGPVLESHLDYWRRQLAGAPPTLELPADAPPHQVAGSRSGTRTRAIPAELSQRLEALGQSERATLFMTLLAAFEIAAGRLAGREDVVVGTPIAGRNHGAIEGLIGFFVNTLVLRVDLANAPTFRGVLDRVRQSTLDAYAHQDLPFEKLVEVLHPERSLNRTPLFQVFFNMLNTTGEELRLPNLEVEWVAPPAIDSKFDLTLYARPRPEGVLFTAVYNADLFADARIEEFLSQFEVLLAAVADDPDRRIDGYSLVSHAAESILPDPQQPLPVSGGPVVHEQFATRAAQTPNAVAVSDPADSWTYGELEARSNQLAHRLVQLGVRPGDVVAIYAERTASLPWAMLSILKAGGAFLVLDSALPASRSLECARQARPVVWLELAAAGTVPAPIAEFLAAAGTPRLVVPTRSRAEASKFLTELPAFPPAIRTAPEALAYVAFTSGSTGAPKGILGTHEPLSHFFSWHAATFGLAATDRFSMLSGLAHDPLLRDLFTPLTLGATLLIPDPEDLASDRLAAWMARERVTVAHLTPGMGVVLAAGVAADRKLAAGIPSLRWLFFGGDRLTRRDLDRASTWAPGARCVNFYGTTETPQAMGWHQADVARHGDGPGETETEGEVLPVGRGIDGVQLLLLNRAGVRCGVGELGEIHVRTPHLARGYLGDEALTRERFVAHPADPARIPMYRTGDLGRYRVDGTVDFAGRADQQLKIRGHRVEPAEIEAMLCSHDTVGEAFTMVRQEVGGAPRLVAYLVARNGRAPDLRDLRGFLKERLPEFMIPTSYVIVDRIPLTANGKVDRAALPETETGTAEPATQDDAGRPRTAAEVMIATVWRELLQVEQISVYDNFLDLGGHSLLGLEVIARVRRQHGVEIRPRELMFQSLGQIAAACTERMQNGRPVRSSGPLGAILDRWRAWRRGSRGGA